MPDAVWVLDDSSAGSGGAWNYTAAGGNAHREVLERPYISREMIVLQLVFTAESGRGLSPAQIS